MCAILVHVLGFPAGASGKEPTSQCRRHKRHRAPSLGQEDPLEEGTAIHSSILAWRNPMDRGVRQDAVHRVAKSRTRMKWLSMHVHVLPYWILTSNLWAHCYCAVLCLVAQSCPTLCDPMDCSSPGCSVHGDSPSKNTGVGYHALLQGNLPNPGIEPRSPTLKADSLPSKPPVKVKVKLLSCVRLFATPWTVAYQVPPSMGFSILEWVAISFSRRSSRPRDWTRVSRIVGRRFTVWATREAYPNFTNKKMGSTRLNKLQRSQK